nr:FAD-dependent oxidoreductase [Caldilineaceae bacterium]
MSDLLESEVLIIGCGIAGCTTALTLADAGIPVTVVTRASAPEETNTYWAQGGIIYQGRDDSPAALAHDVIQAGAGHSYAPAVQLLAEEGPGAVQRILLDRVAVPFDRDERGDLSLVREGGHTLPRIIHATDASGKAMQIALLNALQNHPRVQLLTGHTAVDLLTPAHHSLDRLAVYAPRSCIGAYLFDRKQGRVVRCLAQKTVLATGGLGQIYLRTTNPAGARGDGLAMAYRTGVRIINAEFVQFHPTAFYQEQGPCFLISEAVRGAGARLVDAAGQPFMQKYEAEWKDL